MTPVLRKEGVSKVQDHLGLYDKFKTILVYKRLWRKKRIYPDFADNFTLYI